MIHPILLCGGSGTRLWPLSRKSYPKQFAALVGETSLFQASTARLSGPGYANPLVLTNSDFRFIVTQQLSEIGVEPGAVLIEPDGRNTAPAVLAAALWLAAEDPDAMMLVAPSDHVVPDDAAFRAAVAAGLPAAQAGRLVTFGIKPTHAETGYGYLELAEDPGDFHARPLALRRFVEKPDAVRAAQMMDAGTFLWNAGIFLMSVRALLEAFEAYAPGLMAPVKCAVREGAPDLGFFRLAPEPWAKADNISIDYAIMEKASNLCVVPFSAGWSDLGSWNAVWQESAPNADGVVTAGPATALDCTDSLLRSEDYGLELVGLGLQNIIAVAMPDAVLVADRSRSEEVKDAVTALHAKQARQATTFPKDHRPWGWSESLVTGERFRVNCIHLHPGAALSMQSHEHRAEHWTVVEGAARVTLDEAVSSVGENQSIFIPAKARHKLENPGDRPMLLIEVQTGSYLGDDDITRYDAATPMD